MNRITRRVLIFLICLTALAAGFFLHLPWATVRYRLTIEAEAGGRPLIGSGVIEVRYQKQPAWMVGTVATARVHGQSVWIDIPGDGPIFALTTSDKHYSSYELLPLVAFGIGRVFGDLTTLDHFLRLRRLSGRRELPLDYWPMFARFQNLTDPTTAEGIDPDELAQGTSPVTLARVNKIWVETTRDPITTGIDEKLPAMAVMRASTRMGGDPRLSPRPGRRKIQVNWALFSRGTP